MWLFSRNIVVFVHNILFSTGSIFFLISCELGHYIYHFLYRFFSKILSLGNYFLAEGESWILSICVTAILFSLFRLLCILPVSKVIPFFGLRNFLSLFILDWRLKSCAQISLFFFLASSIRYLVEAAAGGIVPMLLVSTRPLPLTFLPIKIVFTIVLNPWTTILSSYASAISIF